MKRRRFLKWLGLAPAVAVGACAGQGEWVDGIYEGETREPVDAPDIKVDATAESDDEWLDRIAREANGRSIIMNCDLDGVAVHVPVRGANRGRYLIRRSKRHDYRGGYETQWPPEELPIHERHNRPRDEDEWDAECRKAAKEWALRLPRHP